MQGTSDDHHKKKLTSRRAMCYSIKHLRWDGESTLLVQLKYNEKTFSYWFTKFYRNSGEGIRGKANYIRASAVCPQ